MMNQALSQQLMQRCQVFATQHDQVAVDGEYYDLPDTTVFTTATQKLPEKGRIELNTITADAPASFEWQYELTIKDKPSETFIHLLVKRGGVIEETYGKTVLPVDDTRGQEIITIFDELLQEASRG